jgi:hypothetical protein
MNYLSNTISNCDKALAKEGLNMQLIQVMQQIIHSVSIKCNLDHPYYLKLKSRVNIYIKEEKSILSTSMKYYKSRCAGL